MATSCEELTHWKRLWCWEGLGQEEKGTTEDEMAGWHHWLDGCESEWTLGVGDGQGGLACYDSWGRKESVTTEWLNWTDLSKLVVSCYSSYRRLILHSFLLGTCWSVLPTYLCWASTWCQTLSKAWRMSRIVHYLSGELTRTDHICSKEAKCPPLFLTGMKYSLGNLSVFYSANPVMSYFKKQLFFKKKKKRDLLAITYILIG